MKLKKIFSMITAVLCGINICFTGGQLFVAEAANSSEKLQYGDYLRYNNVDEDEDGNYDYVVITDCALSATEIEIPSEIDGLPVTSIGDYAFVNCLDLTCIEIPDSVTSIGDMAFVGCFDLTSIYVMENNSSYSSIDGVLFNKEQTELIVYPKSKTETFYIIPDSVTSIGNYAFYNCDSLASVTIPDSVTSIGSHAFSDCYGLTSVTMGDGVTSIGDRAFSGCYALTSITIPNSVTSIDGFAFYGCKSLTSITIPDSVTSIGDGTFYGCESFTSVTIPDSVTSIGNWAFSYCDALASVTIPDSVTIIGDSAFYYCDGLTSITIENPNCEIYDSEDTISDGYSGFYGRIYGYENSTAQAYAEKYERNFVALDETPAVTTQVTVTEPAVTTTTQIETNDNLYYDCLTYRKIDDNSDGIYDYAEITGCDKEATEAVIPDKIDGLPVIIADCAFIDCKNLTSVRLPEECEYGIREWTFKGCSALKEITVPKNVTFVENAAFCLCTNLESITILNPDCEIYDNASVISNYSEYNSSIGAYEQLFDGTIYGYNYSTAKTYATKYGRNFVALDEAPAVTTTMPVVTSVTSYISVPQTESIISTRGTAPTIVATTTVTTTTTKSTTVSSEGTTANNENAYLSKSELEMILGDRITIKVNNFDGNVTWTSSDNSIAVVNNGQVEAVGKGEAIIFAMLGETSYLCCNVTVEDNGHITTVGNESSSTTTTTTVLQQEIEDIVIGDANGDSRLNVRDSAFIASKLASGQSELLTSAADYNGDNRVNVRDAAAIAAFLANNTDNDDNTYPYEFLNMNAQDIANTLGDCSYSIFNGGGQCYQITSDNYPGLHILFADLSVSEDFKLNAVPTNIIMTQGSAKDGLYCGMTLSECFEINGNKGLYINGHDSKLETEIIYSGYSFIVQFDSSDYEITNEDYVSISAERNEYYLNCNPKISKISITKI